MARIETGFSSVRILADQVGELVQVGDHGIGVERGVIRGRFNVTLNAERRRLLRRLGRRLAGAVGRHHADLTPGTPFSTTNEAFVEIGAPGLVTKGTTRQSACHLSSVTVQRTYPRCLL